MPHKRRRPHSLRNILIGVVLLIVIVSVIVYAYQMNPRSQPPNYSSISSSTTNHGGMCTFSALWSGGANVSGYIFGSNNTGTFINDTWTPFSDFANETAAYSTATRTLNDTIGNTVSWAFWCNDTRNRWTATSTQNLFIESDKVLLVTSMGNITIELFEDMPITTNNFKNLVKSRDYDGTIFHRVVRNFVIQGGDLTSKGITVANISDELPNKHSNVRGAVAMAKTSSANSATSQFFIDLNDTNAASLDSNYSVFGIVTSGIDVADAISKVPITPTSASNPDDGQPITPVTLISAQFIN
jgi:peptidylprolyl isomerase